MSEKVRRGQSQEFRPWNTSMSAAALHTPPLCLSPTKFHPEKKYSELPTHPLFRCLFGLNYVFSLSLAVMSTTLSLLRATTDPHLPLLLRCTDKKNAHTNLWMYLFPDCLLPPACSDPPYLLLLTYIRIYVFSMSLFPPSFQRERSTSWSSKNESWLQKTSLSLIEEQLSSDDLSQHPDKLDGSMSYMFFPSLVFLSICM